MNSVLPASPFVNSIFLSDSPLRIFLIFLLEFRGQYGTKNDLNRIFQKNINFLKISKK